MRYLKIFFIFSFICSALFAIESAKVLKVVDGDTLKILYRGEKESLRLIGIDAPESRENKKLERDAHHNPELKKQLLYQGKAATHYVKTLVHEGDVIQIEFDAEKRDRYQRLLGYVYLKGGAFLNEQLILSGYARPMKISPNTKYAQRFQADYLSSQK